MTTALGKRVRKVTLTEIEEGQEVDWDSQVKEEVDVSTDELFTKLDAMVQDWKTKLEHIVADALKKMKKNGREKKMMIKYIPGEQTLKRNDCVNAAKEVALADWKNEMNEIFKATQRRLTHLNQDKLNETNTILPTIPTANQPTLKGEDKLKYSKLVDLKTLMKDLDIMYNVYNNRMITKVPVYRNLLDIEKSRNSEFSWWKPICTLIKMMDYPLQLSSPAPYTNEKELVNILQDFSMEQRSRKNAMYEWKKAVKRETATKLKMKKSLNSRANSSAKKMVERRERRKFVLREYESGGEKHFLVVRKKVDNNEDAVDIFSDWKENLCKKKTDSRRKRKISHRAQRKNMIKSVLAQPAVPTTYAEAVLKNLKQTEQPAVEEVFETFASLIDNISAMVEESQNAPPASSDMLDYFHPFRHNFHVPDERLDDLDILSSTKFMSTFDCAQPTITCGLSNRAPIKHGESKSVQTKPRKHVKHNRGSTQSLNLAERREPTMPSWQNLVKPIKENLKPTVREYKAESYFAEWLQHLEEPKPSRQQKKYTKSKNCKKGNSYEVFFCDWKQNLEEAKVLPQHLKCQVKENETESNFDFEDFKNNRRQDYVKVTKIKDKKRTEAQRRSNGKRVK